MIRLKSWILIGVAAATLAVLFVYFGVFDVAADVPHSAFVYAAMKAVRDRSIAVRIKDIEVPPLNDQKLIAEGAEHYDAMCADCHLAPGAQQSEMHLGLYPQPPNLSEKIDLSPAAMFWIIKHGIKMSAMPGWGATHDDKAIWAIVAFLQTLPELSPERYQALTATGTEAHHHHHDSHREDSE
jgi:mono/diheme cytochrome c family protein